MKSIWKYRRTGREYAGEMLGDMFVSASYIDQPPLEGIRVDGEPLTIADQMFDFRLGQWIALANALDHNGLNNLKAMYEALEYEDDDLKQLNAKLMLNDITIKQENTVLKEKIDSLAQINPKTMLASLQGSKDIAEIKK